MGRDEGKQPLLGEEGIRPTIVIATVPSLHTMFQCRQHAICPDRRFSPPPASADLSVGLSPRTTMSPLRHCVRLGFQLPGHLPSTFLRPFAPPALPGFHATMDALTPGWPALRRPRPAQRHQLYSHEHRPCYHPGLPASRVWPSEHSVANHLTAPDVAFTHNPSARQAFWASPCSGRLTGRSGRIAFVILRTAHSSPVASHPLSRGRSYCQLQAGVCMPEGDSHPSDQTRSQAHPSRGFTRGSFRPRSDHGCLSDQSNWAQPVVSGSLPAPAPA